MKKNSAGFTLYELMLSVVLLGIVIVITGPVVALAFTFMDAAKRDENIVNNQRLAGALMSYARNYNNGRIPPPYTGGKVNSGLYNPADTSVNGTQLAMELRNSGVPASAINTDNQAMKNVRVYRVVSGLSYQVPLYFTTGSKVSLTYDVGALVQTRCPSNNPCNTGTPGTSSPLTSANLTTWIASGTDYGDVVFSTLPEQKNMLRITVSRLNRLADRLASEFYTRQRLAAANSLTNFFPVPNNSGAPNLGGINPVANMGCHNGWYRLNAANVNVLALLGLDPNEFGVTAWGGPIEYCRDYEPTGTSTATENQSPHFAALRINQDLSSGLPPTGLFGADVVVTF